MKKNIKISSKNWNKLNKQSGILDKLNPFNRIDPALNNPKTAKETNDKALLTKFLLSGKDDATVLEAVMNPNAPAEVLAKIILEAINSPTQSKIQQLAASNPNCPSDILQRLVLTKKDNFLTQNAAKNPKCPQDILEDIIRNWPDNGVKLYAAKNPNLPSEVISEILALGKNDDVSINLASNPSCPPESLANVLQKQLRNKVSFAAMNNKNCPLDAKNLYIKEVMPTQGLVNKTI